MVTCHWVISATRGPFTGKWLIEINPGTSAVLSSYFRIYIVHVYTYKISLSGHRNQITVANKTVNLLQWTQHFRIYNLTATRCVCLTNFSDFTQVIYDQLLNGCCGPQAGNSRGSLVNPWLGAQWSKMLTYIYMWRVFISNFNSNYSDRTWYNLSQENILNCGCQKKYTNGLLMIVIIPINCR